MPRSCYRSFVRIASSTANAPPRRTGIRPHYLARLHAHRVAISNHRLLSVADGQVTFRWKDYAHRSKQRKMTVTGEEFLRRFMLHVLPRRVVQIRFSGFLAKQRQRQLLPLCQQLIEGSPQQCSETPGSGETKPAPAWPVRSNLFFHADPANGGPQLQNQRPSLRMG